MCRQFKWSFLAKAFSMKFDSFFTMSCNWKRKVCLSSPLVFSKRRSRPRSERKLHKKLLLHCGFLMCCLHLHAASFQNADGKQAAPIQEHGQELPNISRESESNRFHLFTDVLIWSAKESGADNWAQNFSFGSATEDIDILEVHFGWNVGLRCGIDYNTNYAGWDTKWAYTWFRGQGKDQASANNGITSSFLGNFYINNADGAHVSNAPQYQSASIQWKIHFNIFDWELGFNWRGSALSFRPFVGLKGGWIHQMIHSKWHNPINVSGANAFTVGRENLHNNFWGIGPSGGVNMQWKLGAIRRNSFSLFGDFSGAIMWGHWTLKDVYKNNHPQKVPIITSDINGASSMFRGFLGFEWDVDFAPKQFALSVRLGYESQFWLDQLQFYSYNTGRLDNELTLQGGTLDFIFNF